MSEQQMETMKTYRPAMGERKKAAPIDQNNWKWRRRMRLVVLFHLAAVARYKAFGSIDTTRESEIRSDGRGEGGGGGGG
jgi:hypothetical protein